MHKEPDDHKTRTTSKKGRNEEKYLLILSAFATDSTTVKTSGLFEYTGGKPVGLVKARLVICYGCSSLIKLGLCNIAAPDSKAQRRIEQPRTKQLRW
jgi:hypothetical protein